MFLRRTARIASAVSFFFSSGVNLLRKRALSAVLRGLYGLIPFSRSWRRACFRRIASIFLSMFPDSPLFSGLATLLLRGPFDSELDVSDPVALPAGAQRSLSLIQGAIEPGDPIAFAPRVAPRSVLLLQAYSDEVIPNQAGELLAAAMGASQTEVAGHTKPLRYVPLPTTASGVTVNAVAPGYIATDNTRALRDDPQRSASILDRIPAGRWGAADDIAGAAVFLASPAAAYVSGVVLPVDGGWMGR